MPHSSFVYPPRHGVLVYGTAGAVDIVWVANAAEGLRVATALTDAGLCADQVLLAERHRPLPSAPLSPRVRFRITHHIKTSHLHTQTTSPLQ